MIIFSPCYSSCSPVSRKLFNLSINSIKEFANSINSERCKTHIFSHFFYEKNKHQKQFNNRLQVHNSKSITKWIKHFPSESINFVCYYIQEEKYVLNNSYQKYFFFLFMISTNIFAIISYFGPPIAFKTINDGETFSSIFWWRRDLQSGKKTNRFKNIIYNICANNFFYWI